MSIVGFPRGPRHSPRATPPRHPLTDPARRNDHLHRDEPRARLHQIHQPGRRPSPRPPRLGTVTVAKSSGSGAEDAATVSAGTLAPSRRGALRGFAGALIAGVALNSPPRRRPRRPTASPTSRRSPLRVRAGVPAEHPQPHRADQRLGPGPEQGRQRMARLLRRMVQRRQDGLLAQVPGPQLSDDHQARRLPEELLCHPRRRREFDPANPPFDAAKTAEWIQYAEGFTSGALAGDEARAAFAKATWGNYDKSAPLNRFGLCAFGETGGTKALGVNCDGY